eukprot:SAG11_NODE_33172_length_278_cov_22.743017_1_plen_79_part_01
MVKLRGLDLDFGPALEGGSVKLQNADAQQAATERLMIRQAGRFRDLSAGWGDPNRSFWVWLRSKYYSRAETKKSGASNK